MKQKRCGWPRANWTSWRRNWKGNWRRKLEKELRMRKLQRKARGDVRPPRNRDGTASSRVETAKISKDRDSGRATGASTRLATRLKTKINRAKGRRKVKISQQAKARDKLKINPV